MATSLSCLKPSVLLLSTCPFVEPRHGGQLRLTGFANACMVYGSQNIEAPLQRDILASYGVSDAPAVVAGSVDGLLDLPEVTVARSPAEFQSAIRAVLGRPPVLPALRQAGRAGREAPGWQRCLASIPGAVESVLQGGQSA